MAGGSKSSNTRPGFRYIMPVSGESGKTGTEKSKVTILPRQNSLVRTEATISKKKVKLSELGHMIVARVTARITKF